MKAAAQVAELQVLEQLLQELLHAEIAHGEFLQVECALKNGTLIILSQHSSEVVPEPKPMLEGLQQTIQSLQPQVAQLVQLDLQVAGQKRPYATHSFTLQQPIPVPLEKPAQLEPNWDTPATPPAAEEYKNLNRWDETSAAQAISDGSSPHSADWLEQVTPAPASSISPHSADWLEQVTPAPASSSNPHSADWLEQVTPASNSNSTIVQMKRAYQSKLLLPLIVAGACLGFVASLKGVYLLKRTCVIGECELIQTAQQLSQESAVAARQAKSQQQLKVVQHQVAQATSTIQTIPQWSPRYQEAQGLSQSFSTLSATLNQVVTALQNASIAAQRSQNPPHTVQQWQAIAVLYQDAIAILEAVGSNSVLAPLAEQKLPGYRAGLKSINQQLNAEQEATKKLTQARVTAQIATTRQSAAQSLQNWQQAQSTWRLAVDQLVSIPKSSTAYKEAQQLLEIYRSNLAVVSDRTTKEQLSATAYNQAVSLANLATRYEQQNQLTLAVTNWTRVLNSAKLVSSETFYYSKAQYLITSYSPALNQAQDKLRVANILRIARTDLNRTCLGDLQVCNYSLNSQGITVQLTSNYEQALKHILNTAATSGDLKTQASVFQHYQILQQALEAISYNANLPLQVYDAQGSSVHNYGPKTQRKRSDIQTP